MAKNRLDLCNFNEIYYVKYNYIESFLTYNYEIDKSHHPFYQQRMSTLIVFYRQLFPKHQH